MSSSTAVAHFGIVARAMNLDVFGLEPDRQACGPLRSMALIETEPGCPCCATESPNSYCLVCCISIGAFADDRPLVPAGARRLQVAENLRQQLGLEQAIGLGRHLEAAALGLLQPLLLGLLRAGIPGSAAAVALSCSMSPGSANSASSSMSMMPICAVLRRLFELLEQLVDLLQFLLDLQRLGHASSAFGR